MPIRLNDVLHLSKAQIENSKVRFCNKEGSNNPIDLFKRKPGELRSWLLWKRKTGYFKVGTFAIGLVRMDSSNDEWLLFSAGTITKDLQLKKEGINYDYEAASQYKNLFGRVVVRYHKKMRSLCPKAETVLDDLEVKEILPDIYNGFDFPGYDKVSLTYSELETIVKGNYPSYQNALKNQKAVYVLTDTNTGKLYVGSATSNSGLLLDRWSGYITTFDNGNKGLKDLLKEEGSDYFKRYFRYSIIENFNQKMDDRYILERESYWKNVLDSRKHGYNQN